MTDKLYTFILATVMAAFLLMFLILAAAGDATTIPDLTPTPLQSTQTPIPSLTPTMYSTPTSAPSHTPEPTVTPTTSPYSYDDRLLLAKLLEAEVYGMEEGEYDAAMSVLDTVFTRMRLLHASDGTVYGTLTRNGQFPPCVYTGVTNATCGRAESLEPYLKLVDIYLEGAQPLCDDYLNYHSSPEVSTACACMIQGNGMYVCFYNHESYFYTPTPVQTVEAPYVTPLGGN